MSSKFFTASFTYAYVVYNTDKMFYYPKKTLIYDERFLKYQISIHKH